MKLIGHLLWVLFVIMYLGRIDSLHRVGGGQQGNWSWTKSNFHPDDQVDITYTDPDFVPSYTLDGFSDQDIMTGT